MSRIVFVNRFCYPDQSASSQMLSELAFGLGARDRNVHVVTSRLFYDSPDVRLPEREVIKNVVIHRVWSTRFGRRLLIGRSIDYLTFQFCAVLQLVALLRHDDVVVAKTDPPLISVLCALVARYRRARLVNWLQDLFPEIATELDFKAARGSLGRLLRKLRDFSLRAADLNVTIGEQMSERVAQRSASSTRVSVIPNWANGELIQPVPRTSNPLRKLWHLEHRFVIGYSGNMGRAHDFSTILNAARIMNDRPEFCFLFVGGGNQQRVIEQYVARFRLKNVVLQPYQPREMLSWTLGAADVHLVSLKPELEGLIVPSKFYGIAAAARPTLFLGAADGEIATVLDRHQCGFTIAPDDSDELCRRIRDLSEKPEMRQAMGHNARAAFDANWSFTHALTRWDGELALLVRRVAAGPPNSVESVDSAATDRVRSL